MASIGESDDGNQNHAPVKAYQRHRKKYPLGGDVDKEAVFDFPYLLDDETISYIEEFGRVMFIIRGPPSTGKASLSEMIQNRYPEAAFCCADKYFENSFTSPIRNKDSIKLSHTFCEKKAQGACVQNKSLIIVQNTHMRKWEMQPYIDLAIAYNYTVIMAITLYRFDVSPKKLFDVNTDGLNLTYFRRRLEQWVDVPPLFTGWFLGPNDTDFVRDHALSCLESLLGDGKFNRVFNVYNFEDVANYFQARNMLSCIAGFSSEGIEMKNYYLSDVVQDSYGKCFSISILGYIISQSDVMAIVKLEDEMPDLIFGKPCPSLSSSFSFSSAVNLNDNINTANKVIPFKKCSLDDDSITATLVDWEDNEDIVDYKTSFIHLAKKGPEASKIEKLRMEYQDFMKVFQDSVSYVELDDGTCICRLPEDTWVVKAKQKVMVKTIFTGLYV